MAKRSNATPGGIALMGKCEGSTSTSPLGVANHKCPSRERHAEGWLLVAVSLLCRPSAALNSIQCEQSAVPLIELQSQRAMPLPVANQRWPISSSRMAWTVDRSSPLCVAAEKFFPFHRSQPWSCVPIRSVPSERGNSAVITLLERLLAVV